MIPCPACSATHPEEAQKCPSCGHDRALELELAAFQGPALARARRWILIIGIIYAASGFLFYMALGKQADEATRQFVLLSNLALGGVHLGLYFWARQSPFPAAIAALSLFLLLQVATMILQPGNMFSGIILKVIFFVILLKAVSAGLEAQRRRAETLASK